MCMIFKPLQTFVTDPDTNIITMSLNADSLCSSRDMYDRKEILELYPIKNFSSFGHQMHQYQRLPVWMHGEFDDLTIDDREIVYRDQSSFKTYTMKCIAYYNTASVEDSKTVRLLTFGQTQCGQYETNVFTFKFHSVDGFLFLSYQNRV